MTKSHDPGERAGRTKTDRHGAARVGDRGLTRPTVRSGANRATVPRAVPRRRGHVVAVRSSVIGGGLVPGG